MKAVRRVVTIAAEISVVALTMILSGPARAQNVGSKSVSDKMVSMKDVNLRDSQVRSLELGRDEAKDKDRPKAAPETIRQVQEDFKRIQAINTEVMQAYAGGEAPDYKSLSVAMAEIGKRARRLNTNLMLPEPTSVEKYRSKDRSPLLDLNDLIVQFVTNPIFKNVNTMDLKLATQAKRDLTDIIDLSRRLEKSAEKLAKDGSKADKAQRP